MICVPGFAASDAMHLGAALVLLRRESMPGPMAAKYARRGEGRGSLTV